MPRQAINLLGCRFNRLIVTGRAENDKSGHARWYCTCDCGKEVVVAARHLLDGNTQSCGCYAIDQTKKHNTTHGETNSRLFGVWYAMIYRCTSPKHPRYEDWGGRGITVCDEWLHDYTAFRDWALSNGYQSGLSIDRINNDGNYEPSNCRWATAKEQANNRRNNIMKEI